VSYPTFIKVPVFDSTSPDKPTTAWINFSVIMHLEDRGDYTAAHMNSQGAYHILMPFKELMVLIDPEWRDAGR